jgi:hypothetical protein
MNDNESIRQDHLLNSHPVSHSFRRWHYGDTYLLTDRCLSNFVNHLRDGLDIKTSSPVSSIVTLKPSSLSPSSTLNGAGQAKGRVLITCKVRNRMKGLEGGGSEGKGRIRILQFIPISLSLSLSTPLSFRPSLFLSAALVRPFHHLTSYDYDSQDGSKVYCDHVIVTVSLKVLQKGLIDFSPPLPQEKLEAINRLKVRDTCGISSWEQSEIAAAAS